MGIPILGANTASTGDLITNSLRFNDDDSAYLSRQNSSGGSRQIFTTSFWIKRANLTGNGMKIFDVGTSTSTDTGRFYIGTFGSDKLAVVGGATTFRVTNAVLRDLSAWYHIVVAVDSTQGTADNRVKVYLNGNQVTSFDTNNAMTQNQNTPVNENTKYHQIGRNQPNTSEYYDGYIAEFHHVDGTQYAASDFGEFNDNGVWIPKEVDVTYGTNGAHLQFKQTGTSQNSSGIGADTSGNDNHYAVTNLAATDITTDTCTNNFATLNPLDRAVENNSGGITLSEGNCEAVGVNGGNRSRVQSTIGVSSGKWYAEFRIKNGNDHKTGLGIIDAAGANANHGGVNHGVEYRPNDDLIQIYDGGSSGASQTSLTGAANNDIVGIALDADASTPTVQFYLQGSALGNAVNYDLTIADRTFFFYVRDGSDSGSDEPHYVCNFGNIPSTISSPNTDGKYGKFYYAPPSGYYALCTKRLAEFG